MADRTLPPTARRLQQALRSGDVPVSRALVAAGATAALVFSVEPVARIVTSRFGESLALALRGRRDPAAAARDVIDAVVHAAVPACAAMAVVAVALTLAQTGGSVTWRRGRTVAGTSSRALRIFGAGGALIVGAALVAVAARALREIARARPSTGDDALKSFGIVAFDVASTAALVLVAWAALDVIVTRVAWRGRLKMTRAERRQEERDLHGDPAVRRARAEVQRDVNGPRR